MVKVERLPSGSYRARVHLGAGKYKSITGKDKKEVQLKAAQFESSVENQEKKDDLVNPILSMTIAEAMVKYIDLKSNIMSPSTISGYDAIMRNYLVGIKGVKLSEITQEMVQQEINEAAKIYAPKTVKNMHGFLSAVLAQYLPTLTLRTALPKNKKPDIEIPTESEMKLLFERAAGTAYEVPILLAACCGLRKSEIVGLKWDNIDFEHKTIHVCEVRVRGRDNESFTKQPKTDAGNRYVRMFPFVSEVLKRAHEMSTGEMVTNLTDNMIYKHYELMLTELGIRHYRFHDLRHYTVSVMLSLNIPKKYIANYIGHSTEDMIDKVYGHIMAQKKTDVDDLMEAYFRHTVMKSDTKSDTKS